MTEDEFDKLTEKVLENKITTMEKELDENPDKEFNDRKLMQETIQDIIAVVQEAEEANKPLSRRISEKLMTILIVLFVGVSASKLGMHVSFTDGFMWYLPTIGFILMFLYQFIVSTMRFAVLGVRTANPVNTFEDLIECTRKVIKGLRTDVIVSRCIPIAFVLLTIALAFIR